jgi:serine/threonine protein kinase/Tfp pilus assembly protein PilF
MECPKCHQENTADSAFCRKCGTRFNAEGNASLTQTLDTSKDGLFRGKLFAGRYEIIEELGTGGMGRVYRAFDKKVGEEVALKLLKPEIAAEKRIVERFRSELKTARKIRHQNVCAMFDLQEEGDILFITMEYVAGEDLRSFIRRSGRLTVDKSIFVAKQICDGLAEAHRLGVVHRDLKPQNIMIDREGSAHIMDFGIARSLKSEEATEAGFIIGTPGYMSPEQADGQDADQRSDLYALAVILYEMLTGRRPFEADSARSLVSRQRTEIPPDPRLLNPQIPESLGRLIIKGLEKEPAKRYQRAEELHKELSEIEMSLATMGTALVSPPPQQEKTTTIKKNSIAVLPFADLSPQRDQEYFCDGLAEELINALAKLRGLKVTARTSAFASKGKDIDVREIGKQLGVGIVLEGSVRKAGARLRITAQLIDVTEGYHLWSERYDRNFEDIFAIQEEITLAIVDNLRISLLGEEKASLIKRYTQDPEAYNFYLQGRHFWFTRTVEGIQKGMQCFRQAIEKDPNYALAYSGIADCYSNLGFYFLAPQDAFPKAMAAAKQALELDDTLAEAHTSMAFILDKHEWNWSAADMEFKKAMELNPNYANAHHWYALYLGAMDRWVESAAEAKKALDLEPLSAQFRMVLGVTFYQMRLYDKAVEELKKTIEMDPTFFPAHFFLGWWMYPEMAMFEQALAEAQKAIELTRGASITVAALGYAYAMAGRSEQARKVLGELDEFSKKTYVSPVAVAAIHARLGEIDKAFEYLEKAYETRDHWMDYLKVLHMLSPLQADPRFYGLLKKMNLA